MASSASKQSLYNYQLNTVSGQSVLTQLYASLRSTTDLKILNNAQINGSTIDGSAIGGTISSSGRFTNLVATSQATFVNSENPAVYSQWTGNNFSLSNASLLLMGPTSSIQSVTGDLNLLVSPSSSVSSNASLLKLGNPVVTNPDGTVNDVGINLGGVSISANIKKGIVISDPIPTFGNADTTSDFGFSNGTNKFVGFTNASSRMLAYLGSGSGISKSFQILQSGVQTSNNATSKAILPPYLTNPAEFGTTIIDKLLVSFEKLFLSAASQITYCSPQKYLTKLYVNAALVSLQSENFLSVILENGSDDGQIKCIQWLSKTPFNPRPVANSNNNSGLKIVGNFYVPMPQSTKYSSQQQTPFFNGYFNNISNAIYLPTPGSSILLVYDTEVAAWTPMHTGYF